MGTHMITVYSKPDCVQCKSTYRTLDKHGLKYTVVDVTIDKAARATVKALGYQQAPVVWADGDHWSGFRPDRIKAIPKLRAEREAAKVAEARANMLEGIELIADEQLITHMATESQVGTVITEIVQDSSSPLDGMDDLMTVSTAVRELVDA